MSAVLSEPKTSVKIVGANGQISLGKDYAGRQVLVEEREPGVWFVRTAVVIPENEMWLHQPQAASDLKESLQWAARTTASSTPLDAFVEKVSPAKRSKPARQA
jgi:hypothetical protein